MSIVLQTERLLLRPPQAADIGRLVSLLGNRDVANKLARVPHPYTEDDGCAFIVAQADGRARGEIFVFAVLQKSDGLLVGICGVEPCRNFELGYWVGKPYWSQGFATEAARAVASFAFRNLDASCLEASWMHDNLASGRVLEKLGCVPNGDAFHESLSRGHAVFCHKVVLTRAAFAQAIGET